MAINSRLAYPVLGGGQKPLTDHDIGKWALTAKQIEIITQTQDLNWNDVEKELTKNWDNDERFNFQNWVKYYQQGNAEKYNVKTAKFLKQAFGPIHFNLPQSILDTRNTPTSPSFYANDHKTQKQIEEDRAQAVKTKMKSRIRALKLLLDKYNDLLPHQDLDRVFVEVHSLEKSISKLNVRATLEDCVFRTANRLKKMGFEQEAEILIKEADSVPANLTGTNTSTIVAKLEDVSKELAGRDLIRALAESDIMLNNVQLAQYFPELALAQSKLIEAFGYASNKVEDVIARLRGSKKVEKPAAAPLPIAPTAVPQATTLPVAPREEKIKPEEFMEKPVGEVKKTL